MPTWPTKIYLKLEGIRKEILDKNTEFNTASCCLLAMCSSSFKTGFRDSAVIAEMLPHFEMPACWAMLPVDLRLFQEMKHLHGVCERHVADCLMTMFTGSVPKSRVLRDTSGCTRWTGWDKQEVLYIAW